MGEPIQLIVGLGNPGPKYSETRHNAGAQFVEDLANQQSQTLKEDSKFHGRVAKINLSGQNCWLLIPNTYMNLSGQAVGALSKYYKIPPETILVAHDELDFPPGMVKFKFGGGLGGHNGLKDIVSHIHTKNFHRLRIGIGHPGDPDAVSDFVLKPPRKDEGEKIADAMYNAMGVITDYVAGKHQEVMKNLHSSE